jgi:putative hydrolase of the HAD superfamily
VKAIVFDLDGTLLHFTREYRAVQTDALRDVCGEVRDDWLATLDERFFDLLDAHEPDPVRRAFAALDGVSDDEADRLVERLRHHETAMCEPPVGAAADLARLREDHLLGVLTNGVPDWQRGKLRASGLAEYFDAVLVSYEVGAHKPDPTVFDAFERRLPADAYAMVGDDPKADLGGAAAAGWATHRYGGQGFGDLPDAIDWTRAVGE